jgi:hypothetical protein
MNNADSLESVKARIRKLLALSKSDNENEAFIALKKANDLISQYKLDEDSLRFESVQAKSTKTYMRWRTLLGNTVAWLYGCYMYRDCEQRVMVFTGEGLDVFLAGEMYAYLANTILRSAKKAVRKNAKYKFRRDFKYGMAGRICDRIAELGESCSWAPLRKAKIEESKRIVERSVKIISKKGPKNKLNRIAVARGALHGDGVSLARQAGHAPAPQIAGLR